MTVAPGAGTLRVTRRLLWLLVVPVLGLLGVLTALEYVQRMDAAERDLLRRAQERAQELEALARPAMDHVQDLRSLLEARWHDPPDGGPQLRDALQPHAAGGRVDGWSLDAATAPLRERFGQLWSAGGREPDAAWLRRAQMFAEQAHVVHQRAPGFEATWFAAADVDGLVGYPWLASARLLESMGQSSLAALAESRLRMTQRALEALRRNPDETVSWGVPYASPRHGRLVMSQAAMIIVDGRYRGEVSLDFGLDALQRLLEQWAASDEQRGAGRAWIVDARYDVLADSVQPLLVPARAGAAAAVPLAARLPGGLAGADLDATLLGPAQVYRQRGWVLSAAVRIGSPWLYVQATPESVLRAQVLPTLAPNLLLALALLAMFIAGQWLMSRAFVQPALRILGYLRALSTDAAASAPKLGPRWQGWVDAVTDTFRRQRALQQRERQSEALKASIIDHAINAIISTDADGRIVEFNPAAETMFGRARADVIGQPVDATIVPQRLRAEHRAGMARVGAGGAQQIMGRRVQMPALHVSGREFPVEMVLFCSEVGGAVHYTASMTDLSERAEAAEQIERQRDALRQSEKLSAMGGLLAGVAHELNNPLAIVMGRASLLEEKTEGTAFAADALRIREAAERCGRIVRTFLNMARQRPATRGPVQLNDLARAAAEMLGYTLRSHAIDLELTLLPGLPEVMADGDQVGQVLLNLMVNAQHALGGVEGRRRIRLETGLEERRQNREPRVWLRVEDNGPGVPVDVRRKIFEPFFTTKAEGIGTGLGLSVSRSMVREHGGDLVLEKADGGASFRLSLPVSGGAAGEARDSTASMPLDDAPAPQARILVIDDEPEIAELMRSMLESAGWEAAVAESGAVALELLAAARFDAIVSDLRMPDMDGAALWRAVRERHPALARRMLFVTGDTLSPEAQQFLVKARSASLDKPFAKSDLLTAVQALLEA